MRDLYIVLYDKNAQASFRLVSLNLLPLVRNDQRWSTSGGEGSQCQLGSEEMCWEGGEQTEHKTRRNIQSRKMTLIKMRK